jgi:hypothetical protein
MERLFRFVALGILFVVMSAIVWVAIALVPRAFLIPGEFVMAFVLTALLLALVTVASRLYILRDRVARVEQEVDRIMTRGDDERPAPPTPPGPPQE